MTIRHYYAIEQGAVSEIGVELTLIHQFGNVESSYRWVKQATAKTGPGSRRMARANNWYVTKARQLAKLGVAWPISLYSTV